MLQRLAVFVVLGLSGLGCVRSASLQAQEVRRPNIVFIMADDLGFGELGSYGQTKIDTPNLDLLASQGMRFVQHYTSAPVCAPARCSLLTGMHGGHAQVRDNSEVGAWDSFRGQLPLEPGTPTIASMLKKNGYATGCFGKWGLGEPGSSGDPLRQGFDRFFGYNCQRHAHNYYPRYLIDQDKKRVLEGNDRGRSGKQYAPQLIADELLSFVRKHRDQPFFAYWPSVIPHLALQVPDEELERYTGRFEDKPYRGRSYLPHDRPRACYAAMITHLDRQVGRLLALLDELGIADDTIVCFTSDNGTTHLKQQVDYDFFDSVKGLRGLKGSVYEGGIRIPMIVRWPGRIAKGSTTSHPSTHYDAMATLAELAGVEAPASDGISYAPTLLGRPEQAQHEYLYWDFGGYGGQIAIRRGRWKGVLRRLRRDPNAKLELYDLEADPRERKNVAAQHPELVAKLNALILEAREEPKIAKFRFGKYR